MRGRERCGAGIGGGRRENREGREEGKGRKGPAFSSAKRVPGKGTLANKNTEWSMREDVERWRGRREGPVIGKMFMNLM